MPKLGLRPALRLYGGLKLARLLEMREEAMARLARELEADPTFARLSRAGVVSRRPFPRAYFSARRWAGWNLAPTPDGLGELLDSDSGPVRLLRRIGQKRFEACFLKAEDLSDRERARRCGISVPEAARLRAVLDTLYIREQFETPTPAPAKTFSAVAAVAIEGGAPVLRFFHRDVWKGEFAIDAERLKALAAAEPSEAAKFSRFTRRLAFLGRRQTTLYKALQTLIHAQADWLKSGDSLKRQPLTQRSLAVALGVDASAVNRLISNKSIELPWGTETPMKALVPSGKSLARERVAELARRRPELSDEGLRERLAADHQIHLSRRSIAQYRQDMGVGPSQAFPGGRRGE